MAVSNKSDIVRPTKRSQVAKLDSFPQRILESLAGRSMRWLSEETGISTSMLSEYGKGKTPGADKALAIANALGVDLRWLLTGRGNRLGPDADNNFDNDMVALDQVDLRFGLGGSYVDGPVTVEKRQFSREWLSQITRAPPELLFWAETDGDSMEPTIRSGEIILGDRSQTSPRFGDGIWAIALGEIGMIKRLRPLPDGNVEIHSDNPVVPPALAADGELHVIGRVIYVMRRV